MAIMYPKKIEHIDDVPASEKEVFKNIKSQLDDSFHVFHSAKWAARRNLPKECDFIILNREMGFIAVEVKGGIIERKKYEWFTTDSHRNRHSIKDPEKQAKDAMFAFKNYYETKFNTRFPGAYAYGLAFPAVVWSTVKNTFDIPGTRVIDYNRMRSGLDSWCKRLFEITKEGRERKFRPLTDEEFNNFVSIINSDIILSFSIKKAIDMQESEMQKTNRFQDLVFISSYTVKIITHCAAQI